MKIRTDFVTNSSSSSFISYQIDGELLEQVLRHNHLTLKPTGSNFVKYKKSGKKMYLQYEGMNSAPSLAQLLIAALSGGDDFFDTLEYSWLNMYDVEEAVDPCRGTANCTEYHLETGFDGSDESVAKLIYELYSSTDLFERLIQEKDYSHGGGEDYISPEFCDFESSGEHIVRRNGKIAEYYAHPYLGGFGYCGDDEAFLAYSDGRVSLFDYPMEYENQSVIWYDRSAAKTLAALADQSVTSGLTWIEELRCENLKKLFVPECAEGICSEALLECPALKAVYIAGYHTEIEENAVAADVLIVAPVGSLANQYAEAHGNPFEEYDKDDDNLPDDEDDRFYEISAKLHPGVSLVYLGEDDCEYARQISSACEYIDSNDSGPVMVFISRTVQIAENSIQQDAELYGFSGSTAQAYAQKHGITFYAMDGTEFDPEKLPENVAIRDGRLCAKGRVFLRLNGLTDKQLDEVQEGEKLELLPEPDELNGLRVVFRSAGTGEYRGMLAYRAGYTAFYLMQKGYLCFEDVVLHEKGYVTASVLWEEPVTEQTKQQLHLYQLMSERFGSPEKQFLEESNLETYFSAAFKVAELDYSPESKWIMTEDIARLYESGNRLSFRSAYCNLLYQSGLSALCLNEKDYYKILSSRYELYFDPETGRPACLKEPDPVAFSSTESVPVALSSAEEEFAVIYMNQYQRIYNLPLLFTDGGEQDGAV